MELILLLFVLLGAIISATKSEITLKTYPSSISWQMSSKFSITRFRSTVVIPALPHGPVRSQAFWMGLKPAKGEEALQQVVKNTVDANSWFLDTVSCCEPKNIFSNSSAPLRALSPGDELTSEFKFDSKQEQWNVTWSRQHVYQGPSDRPSDGHTTIKTKDVGLLSQAYLAVEVAQGGAWNFGTVTWKNITIESTAAGYLWCFFSIPNNITVKFGGNTTSRDKDGIGSCHIPQIDFISPKW